MTAYMLLIASAQAQVAWVDWTMTTTDPAGVEGVLDVDGTLVDVTMEGSVAFAQTTGGVNYWEPPDPFVSATVPNAPPDSDIVGLAAAETRTIRFSEPVTNPLLALVSLNGDNAFQFDRPFTILSQGTGYWGSGEVTKAVTTHPDGSVTYDVGGTGEPHGVIQFVGTFDTLTFTNTTYEYWHGFTLGVEHLAAAVPPAIDVYEGEGLTGPLRADGQAAPLDFGTGTEQWLTIHNSGTGPLELGSVVVTGADTSAFVLPPLPPVLAAGEALPFVIEHVPDGARRYEATLEIPHDAPVPSPFRVALVAGEADTGDTGAPDEAEEPGCGCASTSGSGVGLALLVGLLTRRR